VHHATLRKNSPKNLNKSTRTTLTNRAKAREAPN
jgi:hypothetical protein